MIVHILRFSFKSTSSDQDITESLQALERIRDMDSVEFGVVGQHMGNPDEPYTHALVFAIKDIDTFEHEYMKDPVHREGDFIIHPHVDKLSVSDVSDDMNPQLAELIMGVQERRFARDPELRALIDEIPDSKISSLERDGDN